MVLKYNDFLLYENDNKNIEFKIISNVSNSTDKIEIEGVGYITGSEGIGYDDFEDVFTEEEYDNYFPDDEYYTLLYLSVESEFRGKGYARILVNKLIQYAKELNYKIVYLNACPYGNKGLNLIDLIEFYEEFGFQEIKRTKNNSEMILEI